MQERERSNLVKAINEGNLERVNAILQYTHKYTLQPWCVEIIRGGIALASISSPPVIRETITELLESEPKINWD
jgi:hypothetical protein